MSDLIDIEEGGLADEQADAVDMNADETVETEQLAIDDRAEVFAEDSLYETDVDENGVINKAAVGFDTGVDKMPNMLESVDPAESVWGDIVVGEEAAAVEFIDPYDAMSGAYDDFSFPGFGNLNEVHGTPIEDMALWDEQDDLNSCAVATTKMMLESVGINVDEPALAEIFSRHEIYDPSEGTFRPDMIDEVVNVEAARSGLDIRAEQIDGFTVDDLEQMLDEGKRPLIGVDSSELYQQPDFTFREFFGIPDAGHAVLVTGIMRSNEGDMVVINDPGFPSGAGQQIPLERFMDAAADCGFSGTAIA